MTFLTILTAVLLTGIGAIDASDQIDYDSHARDGDIEIVGVDRGRYTHWGSGDQGGTDVAWHPGDDEYLAFPVIRDFSGAFCVSDLQTRACIPDSDGAVDEEAAEEPTVVDVVSAAAAQIERDIARLGVRPARINLQPPGGEVLVNIDTIFYTEASVQYLSTTVLGRAVTIEVTPRWFRWDFGDGSPIFETSGQGAPYPNPTITHVYRNASDNFVTLRTTWNARFRVEGVSNWIPVTGQPVTVDQAGPIRSVTKTNRLVTTE